MKPIDQLNAKLFQTSVREVGLNLVRVIIHQNNFFAGTVNIEERVFVSVPRSSKNIFNLFGGGLGLNAEVLNIILPFFLIKKIVIPYQNTILETTLEKWIKLGIVSPFCNQKVDKQIILSLRDISLVDTENYRVLKTTNQLKLFSEAI